MGYLVDLAAGHTALVPKSRCIIWWRAGRTWFWINEVVL